MFHWDSVSKEPQNWWKSVYWKLRTPLKCLDTTRVYKFLYFLWPPITYHSEFRFQTYHQNITWGIIKLMIHSVITFPRRTHSSHLQVSSSLETKAQPSHSVGLYLCRLLCVLVAWDVFGWSWESWDPTGAIFTIDIYWPWEKNSDNYVMLSHSMSKYV